MTEQIATCQTKPQSAELPARPRGMDGGPAAPADGREVFVVQSGIVYGYYTLLDDRGLCGIGPQGCAADGELRADDSDRDGFLRPRGIGAGEDFAGVGIARF